MAIWRDVLDEQGKALEGVEVCFSGGPLSSPLPSQTTDAQGAYEVLAPDELAEYVVTPSKAGCFFVPTNAKVWTSSGDATANFVAHRAAGAMSSGAVGSRALPDLTVYNVSYQAKTYRPGSTIMVTGTVANRNAVVPAGRAIRIEARLSTDLVWGNSDDVVVFSYVYFDPTWDTPPGVYTATVAATIPANARAAAYYLIAKIDSGGALAEASETNNTWRSSARNITVQGSGGTCPQDKYEEDDSFDTASTISKGQTQVRTIHVAGNKDYVKFVIKGVDRIGVRIEAQGPAGGDPEITLYGRPTLFPIAYVVAEGEVLGGVTRIDRTGSWALGGCHEFRIEVNAQGNNHIIPRYTLKLTFRDPDLLRVGSPNGPHFRWFQGRTERITWTCKGNPGPSVRIELFKGKTRVRTIASSAPNSGRYYWKVPSDLESGTDYWVRVTSTSDDRYTDQSAHPFVILGPDAYEADNTPATARTIANGQTQKRTMFRPGGVADVDYAKFTLTQWSAVTIEAPNAITLLGPNSATEFAPAPYGATNGGGDAKMARIQHTESNPLPPGTYYIQVTESHGMAPTWESWHSGLYTLTLKTAPAPAPR